MRHKGHERYNYPSKGEQYVQGRCPALAQRYEWKCSDKKSPTFFV